MDRKGAGLAGLLLAGVMVFGITACGGGSDEDESSSKAESSATVPTASEDDASGGGGSSSDGLSVSDFLDSDCADAVAAYTSIVASSFGGSAMLSDEEKQKMEDGIAELEGKVPAELEDDISFIADAFQSYFEALGDMDLSDMVNNPGKAKEIEAAGEKLDSAQFQQAQENVEDFFEQHCPSMAGAFSS
jgi:hypothetical protein